MTVVVVGLYPGVVVIIVMVVVVVVVVGGEGVLLGGCGLALEAGGADGDGPHRPVLVVVEGRGGHQVGGGPGRGLGGQLQVVRLGGGVARGGGGGGVPGDQYHHQHHHQQAHSQAGAHDHQLGHRRYGGGVSIQLSILCI